MMTRAEKLFNIRAQVQKGLSFIDHGDGPGTDMALADALIALVTYCEEEMPEKPEVIHGPDPEAVDAMLHKQRIKVKK